MSGITLESKLLMIEQEKAFKEEDVVRFLEHLLCQIQDALISSHTAAGPEKARCPECRPKAVNRSGWPEQRRASRGILLASTTLVEHLRSRLPR
jgi:hypothetical protein